MRLHIVVSGRVQGVGFRYFTQMEARSLGLTGWARNTMHGNVEIEVQGSQEAVGTFCVQVRNGPSLSRVTGMTSNPIPERGDEQGFKITF